MTQSNEMQISAEKAEVVEKQDPPTTFKHKLRLWGSLIIVVTAFWVARFGIPEPLNPPPYDAANLNEAQLAEQAEYFDLRKNQAEHFKQQKESVQEVTVDGQVAYLLSDHSWTHERPSWFDLELEGILYPGEKSSISDLAIVSESISSWITLGESINYIEYNKRVSTFSLFIWIGLAHSLCLYISLFHRNRSKEGLARTVPVLYLVALTSFTALGYYSDPRMVTYAFGVPFACMFLLWALTREPKSPQVEKTKPVAAEEVNDEPA